MSPAFLSEYLSHVGLLSKFDVEQLLSLLHLVDVLDAHDTTTPVLAEVVVLVEVGLEHLAQVLKVSHVLGADGLESHAGRGLLVDQLAEHSLSSDEAVGDTLSSAESWQVHDQFNRVNIVGNHDQLNLAFLNQRGHVVQTELQVVGLGSLVFTTFLSFLLESQLLFLLGLRGVLSQQFKQLGRYNP